MHLKQPTISMECRSALPSGPGKTAPLWLLFTKQDGGLAMLQDFSKAVQLLKMLGPALPSPTLILPWSSPAPRQPRLPPTQSHTGGSRQASRSASLLESTHRGAHSRPRCVRKERRGGKGHCSKPFARISELKMEDLSFAQGRGVRGGSIVRCW